MSSHLPVRRTLGRVSSLRCFAIPLISAALAVSALGLSQAAAQAAQAAPASGSASGAAAAEQATRPAAVPLSAEQEQRRAAQAQEMYGSPEIRPMDQRKTSALAMGDSQMSGEGAFDSSLYDPNTNREGNYCHRASSAVGNIIDLPVDVKLNIACSGAQTFQISSTKQGGSYYFEENQGDQLEVLARNTNIKYLYMFIGANDPEGLNFGPRVSDCVERRIFLQPVCWRNNTNDARRSVDVVTRNVTTALNNLKQTMAEAGYLPGDYKLILGGYPSPINPNWDISAPYAGGCLIWESDAYFARNKVVPMFANAMKQAAADANVQFLDMRSIFDGHSPCTPAPWLTGVYNSSGNIFNTNDFRQSLHPNPEGHQAFSRCFSAAFRSDAMVQTCQVKAGEYWPTITTANLNTVEVSNRDTGLCLGTHEGQTKNSYRVESVPCLGSVMTSLIYDTSDKTLHHPQSYDKCWDVWAGNLSPGAELSTWDCHGAENQRFVFHDDGTIRPESAQNLCVDAGRWGGNDIFGAHVTLANCNPSDTRQVFDVQAPQNHLGRFQFDGTDQCIETDGGKFDNNTGLGTWTCGSPQQSFIWHNGVSESFITDLQGHLCFDANPVAGAAVKIVPCGWHDYQYRQFGQFKYELDNGYIRNRENPDLVLSAWGQGQRLTWDRVGASAQQKVTFVQDSSQVPGENYSDWLPRNMNNS